MKKFVAETINEVSGTIIGSTTCISCGLMTYVEADEHRFGVHIPYVLKKLISIHDEDDTALDYANKFENITGIKSVSYLRVYRDYYGQIE